MSYSPLFTRTAMLRLSALGVFASSVGVSHVSQASGDSMTVPIVGLRNDQGQVACTLYASADGFPTDPSKAVGRQFVRIASKSATCLFENVPAGSYAIAVMHDENGNGRLDKNFLGIPTEGLGASRDARATMGPPKWQDAVFAFAGGSLQMPITIHY